MAEFVRAWRERWRETFVSPQARKEVAALAVLGLGVAALLLSAWWLTVAQQAVLWAALAGVAAVLLRQGWLKVLGPVLFYDLVRTARRTRFVVVRTLYALLLAGILLWLFLMLTAEKGGRVRSDEMSTFANGFFYTFLIVQWTAVALLTPAYVAGAIAEEKERKTLEFLLATDLRDREIVLGKLASRLLNLTLLLLAGLPILSFMQFLGGVDPGLVLASFAATALSMFGLAGVSMLNSVLMRRAREAIVLTYLYFLAYHMLALLSRLVYFPTIGLAPWPQDEWPWFPFNLGDLSDWFNTGNVFYAAYRLVGRRGVVFDDELPGVLLTFAAFHGAVGLYGVGTAVWKLRAVALRDRTKRTAAARTAAGKPVVPERLTRKPPVGDAPVLWKEVHGEGAMRFNAMGRVVLGVAVAASLAPTITVLILYLQGKIQWSGGDGVDRYVNIFQLRMVGSVVATLLLLRVVVHAANSVSGERERDTLDALLTTPLGPREILFGKWAGAVLSVRWGWAWLGIIWAAGVLTGGMRPWCLPLLLAAWGVYATAFAGVGLWFSVTAMRTLRATVAALATALVLGGGHWLLGLMFCYLPLSALGVREPSYEWLLYLELGQTPPVVLGLFAYFHEDFAHHGSYASTMRMTAASLFGLACWAAAAFGLWHLVLARFRKATHREDVGQPERVPVRSRQPVASTPKAATEIRTHPLHDSSR